MLQNGLIYLDLYLKFDKDGKLFTRFYDKRDDFDFPIVNFPYLSSIIPESPAYGVFVCFTVDTLCSGLFEIWFSVQMIYSGFKVIEAGILFTETSDYFRKFYGRHTDRVHKCVTYVEWYMYVQLWHMTGFQLFGGKSWWVPHVGQEMLTLSGTHLGSSWFHPFIICRLYITEFISSRTMFTD